MTAEEINIAIAEACGVQTEFFKFTHAWHDSQRCCSMRHKTRVDAECAREGWIKHGNPTDVEPYTDTYLVPDYYNNLNACAEMEDGLDLDGELDYEIELDEVTGRDGTFIWHATAPQRCEAFLRTKGLWRD